MSKRDFIADISDYIFISDAPQKADVIFIPGGSHPELPEYAARLFTQGFAPCVLPSGRFSVKHGVFAGPRTKADVYPGPYATEFDFMADVLQKNGVPAGAIIKEDRAEYTQQNAMFSRRAADLAGLSVQRALIVCKAFHARRCLAYYSMAFPAAELLLCPAPAPGPYKDDWFLTERGIDRVLGELARCGSQMTNDVKAALLKNAQNTNI